MGVTLLFGMADTNGTLELLTQRLMARLRCRMIFLPLTIYLLVSLLTAMGMGNIPVIALIAPVAMRIARDTRMPSAAMSLLLVGAANGAAFSPFSLSGVIVSEFLRKNAGTFLSGQGATQIGMKLFLVVAAVQLVVTTAGFFLLGGAAWLRGIRQEKRSLVPESDSGPSPNPPPSLTRVHWVTLGVLACFVSLLVMGSLGPIRDWIGPRFSMLLGSVGALSFIGASVLMLIGVGRVEKTVGKMPWSVLLLVCGMVMLTSLAETTGALRSLSLAIVGFATETSLSFWIGLASGALSSFSSSTGVALPLFLPMVPSLQEAFPTVLGFSLLTAVALGSHIVDASPLSTLGALCVSNEPDPEKRPRLFRTLLIWGACMAPVGAAIAWMIGVAADAIQR